MPNELKKNFRQKPKLFFGILRISKEKIEIMFFVIIYVY
jgi:hypothetical protein